MKKAFSVLLILLCAPVAAQVPKGGVGSWPGKTDFGPGYPGGSFAQVVTVAADGTGDFATLGSAAAYVDSIGEAGWTILIYPAGVGNLSSYAESALTIPAGTTVECLGGGDSYSAAATQAATLLFNSTPAGALITMEGNTQLLGCGVLVNWGTVGTIVNPITADVDIILSAPTGTSYTRIADVRIEYSNWTAQTTFEVRAVRSTGQWLALNDVMIRHVQLNPGPDSPYLQVDAGDVEVWGGHWPKQVTGSINHNSHAVRVVAGEAWLYGLALNNEGAPGGFSVADIDAGGGAVWLWGGTCGLATLGTVHRMDDACAHPVTLTIADSGDGAAAAGAILDRGQLVTEVDCQDADGCDLTFPDSGREREMAVVNTSANAVTITDAAGVVETIGASAVLTAANSSASFRRVGGAWIQTRAVSAP